MRFLRQPTRFLLLWTAICAVPIYVVVSEAMQPVPESCFEWCDIAWPIARMVTTVVGVIWLVVVVLVIWLWNRR